MPRMDGTGPMGQGPLSGRGMGKCSGAMRRGCYGRFCMGMGRRFYSPKNELASLQEEEQFLREELDALEDEIKALKDQK